MGLPSVGGQFLLGFMYTYLVKQTGMDPSTALLSNSVAISVFALCMPIGGALSDRYGRRRVLFFGAFWTALVAYLSMRLASDGTFFEVMGGQVLIATGVGLYNGAAFVAAAESFPTSFRGTGHALGYQVTVALLGGTSPLICAWLAATFQTPLAPAWYVTAIAAATIVLLPFIPETNGVDLRASGNETNDDLTNNCPVASVTASDHG
jgi:MHS family proline/betaine transporter-like MFS transporter